MGNRGSGFGNFIIISPFPSSGKNLLGRQSPGGLRVVDGIVTSPHANKRGAHCVFLPVAIVLGRKPSSNLRRSGRAMATRTSRGFRRASFSRRSALGRAVPLMSAAYEAFRRHAGARSLLSRGASRHPAPLNTYN